MPRFYFHVLAEAAVHDEEGVELRDLEHALVWARGVAQQRAAQAVAFHELLDRSFRIVISDGGREIAAVAFEDVVAEGS